MADLIRGLGDGFTRDCSCVTKAREVFSMNSIQIGAQVQGWPAVNNSSSRPDVENHRLERKEFPIQTVESKITEAKFWESEDILAKLSVCVRPSATLPAGDHSEVVEPWHGWTDMSQYQWTGRSHPHPRSGAGDYSRPAHEP
ncbi:hypothetical protein RRG08_039244 [Elysia crispata]|uniref:Uncharacterized protein n=1 Tax=Elysia crispata TaxID=231223 RepID=A0AAE1BDI8_9GAST|nr:hypothetical protein RRG08_039244 [Elysia crispata]